VEHIRNAQTIQARLSQFDQGLGSVTHQKRYFRAQCLEPGAHYTAPGLIGAMHRHRFPHQVATGQVHAHEHHALHKGFVHGPDDRAYLAMVDSVLLPSRSGLHERELQPLHQPSQGARRAPHMGCKMKAAEKLADRVGPNSALKAEEKERGNNQADEPGAAFRCFPQF
jgi:hypothetical protein